MFSEILSSSILIPIVFILKHKLIWWFYYMFSAAYNILFDNHIKMTPPKDNVRSGDTRHN